MNKITIKYETQLYLCFKMEDDCITMNFGILDGYNIATGTSPEEVLLRECCLGFDDLEGLCREQGTNEPVIDISTVGTDNILCTEPRVYKHHLLKTPRFRRAIVDFYRNTLYDYKWVDIVVLNRRYWKIFLFQHNA